MVKIAKESANRAYTPYSKFKVGAAILTKTGKIYSGCNIENVSYGLTICAERVAIFKALSEGERNFSQLIIYSQTKDFTMPCGACLQVLAQFCRNLKIIIVNQSLKKKTYQLKNLLPKSFRLSHLKNLT